MLHYFAMQRFKMLAKDNNSLFPQYRTWVVSDQPDYEGELYIGLKSGSRPFINVSAFYTADDNAIIDFNLPNPLSWDTTKLVLPEEISNSQLAVVDGYVYLFGGIESDKIFRAPLNNPGSWEDTGAVLPVALSCSHLAIIGDFIFLFGGEADGIASSVILAAPMTDPLDWDFAGEVSLPVQISNAQLFIVDGYVYLVGGKDENGRAADYILRASLDDPTDWTLTAFSIPDPLYNSHVAIIDNKIYLFGGLSTSGVPTSNIYRSTALSDSSWEIVGNMPFPVFNGQFFTIGVRGYLIAPSESSTSFTRIFRCKLDDPTSWIDTSQTVPGIVDSAQFAIIDDKLFLFGGNASSVIYTDNSIIKYNFSDTAVTEYADVTRTQFDAAATADQFTVLGFPPWKTNYGS